VAYEQHLRIEMNGGNQSILISADVEDMKFIAFHGNHIDTAKGLLQFSKIPKGSMLR